MSVDCGETDSQLPLRMPRKEDEMGLTPVSLCDRYQFMKQIGHGSQAKVFLAEDLKTGQKVAIKQLNIESVKTWKEYDLFHREADVLRTIDIRGIAKLHETIECLDDNPPCSYIVQEYIQGQNLNEMLKAGHRFSLTHVYEMILQLLDILEKLHTHEPPVIHRDIKPSNILLNPVDGDNDMVYLIDFGAVANPQVQSGGSTVAGTYGYMPPEQLTGKPQPASDIYALAAVAVHLMSGRSPADMPVKDFHLIFEPDLQNLPPVVVNTLRQMLEPDISKRLADIPKLKKLFNDFKNDTYPDVQNAFANDAEYHIALSRVESLGQPGNIELWQRLPDLTPRELPSSYKTIELQHPDIQTSEKENSAGSLIVERIFNHVSDDAIYKPNRIKNQTLLARLVYGSIVGVFAMMVVIMLGLFLGMSRFAWLSMYCLIAFPIVFFVYLFIVFLLIVFILPREKLHLKEPELIATKLTHHRLSCLLTEGRKTIATITDVEFVPCSDAATELAFYIMDNEDKDPSISAANNKGCQAVRLDTPMFRIKYKFNPPDDSKSSDLFHEILVCSEPDDVLKPGDPLPILYRIHKNNDGSIEFVDSMPFPLPLNHLMVKENVLYEDQTGTTVGIPFIMNAPENNYGAISKEDNSIVYVGEESKNNVQYYIL